MTVRYISIFVDLDARRVVFATEGRSAQTIARFAADLSDHGRYPEKVTDISSDMSTAFISGISRHLQNATMTFDRYHLPRQAQRAIDIVRRDEVNTLPELKHTRWLWLKNHANLSAKQQRDLHRLMRPSAQLATARALLWREDFQAFHDQHPSYTPDYLRRWCYGAKRSRLQPIKEFVTLVENHLSNGLLEDQLSGLGSQSPRLGLPQQNQNDHHRLPHRGQTPTTHPHQPNTRIHALTLSNPLKNS